MINHIHDIKGDNSTCFVYNEKYALRSTFIAVFLIRQRPNDQQHTVTKKLLLLE